jgi:flagellar motor switch protein FliM
MSDILDQQEVDMLLAALEADTAELPSSAHHDPLSRPPRDLQVYDFKRPERVSKEQMRSLESLHETFARNFGASLSGYLRTIIEVRQATIEQLTYSEFIQSLPNPTNFNLLTAEPLNGQMCLEVSPLIIYPILDRLLGGSNAEVFIPQRPLTTIELRVVNRITERALNCLTEVWSEMVEVRFAVREVESNPHLMQIVAPNEVVVVIGFEIKMGPRMGTMSLCIPFTVIEPVVNKIVSQGWLAYQRHSATEARSEELARCIGATNVTLTAYLATTTITMHDLLTLQTGDILQTTKPRTGEHLLQVEGENKFAGVLGRHKDNLAIKITRRAEVEEPL